MKFYTKLLSIALITPLFISCSDDDNTDSLGNNDNGITITAFVENNDNYTLLAAALEATDLDETLNDSNAQFTVFAPDNDALTAFLATAGFPGGLAEVDEEDEIDLVKNILLNHVVIGELKATNVVSTAPNYLKNQAVGPEDLSGTNTNLSTYYSVNEGTVMINGEVEVTTPDAFDASNGIIHAIDKVIGLPNISTFATADARLSTLANALTEADLVDTVDGFNPATVFAPTNDAFDNLASIPTGGALSNVLTYHVISGSNIVSTDVAGIIGQETPATVQGQTLSIVDGPAIEGNTNTEASGLVIFDVQAINGVIHVIDRVLLPSAE